MLSPELENRLNGKCEVIMKTISNINSTGLQARTGSYRNTAGQTREHNRRKSMRRILYLAFFVLVLAGSGTTTGQKQSGVEGTWYGALSLPNGAKLKMAIEFEKVKGQTIKATIISLDQGAMGIAADEVKIQGNKIRLTIEEDGVVIEGTFDKSSSTISAHWKQGPVNFPLQLKLVESVPGFRRPQTPKRPFPYIEEEVTFTKKAAAVKLAGTLTLPRSKGPHPAAILLQGSGPHGRDEMVCYHRPFLVLADYLTRNGIAILRYDKRGTNHSTGDYGKATIHDFASDASAAVEYLKTRREIDSSGIGLIGHSEGGTVAQIVAADPSDVAFIVSIAGPGISGCENIILQDLASAKTKGATDQELELIRQVVEQYYRVPLAEKNNDVARKKMQKIYDDMTDEQRHAYRYLKDGWTNQIDNCLSPGCRSAHEFDPRPILMKVKCPVLAINGALDIQVPPKENLDGIEEALKAGGNSNFTVKELPGLNHLLQTADTGAFAEYTKIEETIAPVALETIGNWIKEHVQ
jgi:pimeloyl-ACP methyl ester carboxylesterase